MVSCLPSTPPPQISRSHVSWSDAGGWRCYRRAHMRLIKVGCRDYKRFRGKAEMDVDAKLIAIVGPNEAGKTTFLDALAYLDTSRGLESREQTRGLAAPETSVWARYALDDEDKAALALIREAAQARQLIVTKYHDELDFEIEPDVRRDLRLRRSAQKRLEKVTEHKLLRERPEDDVLPALASAVVSSISSDGDLSDEQLEQIGALEVALRAASSTKLFQTLAAQLEHLREHEAQRHPRDEAIDVLASRRPRFLLFEANARELLSAYSFDEEPNVALLNLLSLAGTSWNALHEATSDAGRIEGILQLANERLAEVFRAWHSSP
jgi:predicted ATP-dependent endonuclease of OLD family